MKTVFISAPIAADTAEGVAANIGAAEDLARLAVDRGYAPICVHSAVARNVYGSEATPEDRERGIQICCAIVRSVAQDPDAEFWVRLKQDGSLSDGCKQELAVWRLNAGWLQRVRRFNHDLTPEGFIQGLDRAHTEIHESS